MQRELADSILVNLTKYGDIWGQSQGGRFNFISKVTALVATTSKNKVGGLLTWIISPGLGAAWRRSGCREGGEDWSRGLSLIHI